MKLHAAGYRGIDNRRIPLSLLQYRLRRRPRRRDWAAGDGWQVPAVELHSGKSTGLPDYSGWASAYLLACFLRLLFFLPHAVKGSGTAAEQAKPAPPLNPISI